MILDARLRGSRPKDQLVVSFVGETGYGNPHVYADTGKAYDWRFLRDLPVLIAVKPGIDARGALQAIFEQAMLYPTLVDVEQKEAASVIDNKPLRLWMFTHHSPAYAELFA